MYCKYAVPMHRRDSNSFTNRSSSTHHIQTTNPNVLSTKRSQRDRASPPSIETVTSACKKIKLFNSHSEQRSMDHKTAILKRQNTELINKMECATIETTPATKRKKITWP